MRARLTLLVPRVGFGALAVACFAVPIVFTRQTAEAFMVPKATVLWLCSIVAVMGLAGWSIAAHRSPLPRLHLRWPLALLVGWSALATVFSVAPWLSFVGHYGRYDGFLGVVAGAALLLCVVGYTWRSPARLRVLVIALIGSAVVGLAYITIQQLGLDWIDWVNEELKPIERPYGLLGNSNFSGAHLAICIPLTLALAHSMDRRSLRFALWGLTGALGVGIWWTGTRGGMLAAVGGVAVAASLTPGLVPRVVRYGTIVLTVLGLTVVLLASTGDPTGGSTGLDGPRVLQSNTLADRREIWQAGFHMVQAHPLVGVGPDAFGLVFPDHRPLPRPEDAPLNADEAHNIFIDRLATAGIPALGAYLWLVITVVAAAWRGHRRVADEHRWLVAGFGGAFGAYLLQGSFSIDTAPLALFGWVCMGALAALTEPAVLAAAEEAPEPVRLRPLSLGPLVGLGAATTVLVALALKPLVADLHFRDGQEAITQGRRAAVAAADFRAAADWLPTEPRYHVKAGDQLAAIAARETRDPVLQTRLLTEALTAYDQALELSPGDIFILRSQARVHGLLADIDTENRDEHYEAALDLYAGLVERTPTDLELRQQYALTLEARANETRSPDHADAASEQFRQMLELSPTSTGALSGLARLAVLDGRLTDARDLLEQAQELEPGDTGIAKALDQVNAAIAAEGD